jgi:hypothetical protein
MVDDTGVTSADAGADVDGLQGLASTIDPKALDKDDTPHCSVSPKVRRRSI